MIYSISLRFITEGELGR